MISDLVFYTISQQCGSLCTLVLALLPSIHFSPSLTRGGWEAMAGIITSQNTLRPLSSATATQDYCNTVYKQVDRSCVPHCTDREGDREKKVEERGRRNRGKNEEEKREWAQKKARRGPVYPQGANHNYSYAKILDICISMTQIMFAWTWKDCKRSKVRKVWWMSDWSLPPQSLYQKGLAFLPLCYVQHPHTRCWLAHWAI